MIKRKTVLYGAATLMLLSVGASAEVRLDDCFGDNMVIQRELPARFRGTASPGEKVTLKFAGQTAETTADRNGDWKLVLAPLKADKTPRELTVKGENSTVTLKNVLVGEVWLCTGQSNMFYLLGRKDPGYVHTQQKELVAAANYPLIRIARAPSRASATPERKITMCWTPVTPESIKMFSAVGYFFGIELLKALDVPIGLVGASRGGTAIEAWTNLEGFRSVPEGKKLAHFIAGRTGGTPEFEANAKKLLQDHGEWIRKAVAELAGNRLPPPPPPIPESFRNTDDRILALDYNKTPGVLYNAMLHPLTGMTVRGAIWYQGEQNLYRWYDYRWQMHALLNGWKLVFENPDLQFHFVQIAPYRYNRERPMTCTGLWDAQQKFADETGCGMAVINDWGNPNDIHPDDKRPVGHRLALLALNRTYGKKEIACDAPRLDKWQIDGGKFILSFKDAASFDTSDGKAVFGFEVAGIDGKYFKADAKIHGAKIEVSSPRVDKPRYLRYLAHNTDCGNLRNEHGLVPAPFRVAAPTIEEELKYLTGRDGLIYEYDLFSGVNAEGVMKPAVDNSQKFAGKKLSRLHYLFVFKTKDGKTKFVDIAMAPFTQKLELVGVPGSKARKNLATTIRDINLRTNAPELIPDSEVKVGNIEFFFTGYRPQNRYEIRGANDKQHDAGDRPAGGDAPGYGCMQFHAYNGFPIFCFNNFKAGNHSDAGFGINPNGEPDWTFSRSGRNYSSARLCIFGEFK